MQAFFGSSSDTLTTAESGYLLFYQAVTLQDHFEQLARGASSSPPGVPPDPIAAAVAHALAAQAASPVPPAPPSSSDSRPTGAILPSHLNR